MVAVRSKAKDTGPVLMLHEQPFFCGYVDLSKVTDTAQASWGVAAKGTSGSGRGDGSGARTRLDEAARPDDGHGDDRQQGRAGEGVVAGGKVEGVAGAIVLDGLKSRLKGAVGGAGEL
jgi:hypothetical protein